MLENGFPVNTENEQGNTLLMQAVFSGREDTVKMLLRYAPDLQHRNQLGETVFDTARVFPELNNLLQKYSRP